MRRNFAQVLKEGKVDLKKEYSKLYDLFYGKDPRDGKSLADLISLNFEGFYFRGTCLDLGEFDKVHGFRFEEQPKIFDIDYLVSFCEYIYNFVLHFEDHYFFGQINKSFDYVTRMTKFPEAKVTQWEDEASGKFPTINQAKALAKCYRIPFAGLYMNFSDINVKHLPQMRNLRTLPDASVDNSALNLAIADILSARELLIESKKALKETIPAFSISINEGDDVSLWARTIRNELGLTSEVQYKCPSARQLYLLIRNATEEAGVFVHCFTGIDTEIVRGFAIYDDVLPMIGLNNEDRYPAKTFSIIHELVHLIKRSSAVCNEMMSSFSAQKEEVFCNAVAGEVLVPKANLLKQLGSYTADEIDLDMVETIAAKFSVSKEVVCRRLLDTKKISQAHYSSLMATIRTAFENEREQMREYRRITGKTIPRNISREAIDQNSSSLCKTFYHGFREGYFDKQDVARYLGVKQNHIDKFMWEVSKW